MTLGVIIALGVLCVVMYKAGYRNGYNKCENEFNGLLSASERRRRSSR